MDKSTAQESQSETLYLWWLDRNTQARQQAGVAFYEEKYGEYRLKIDFISALLERPSQIYLRSIGSEDDRIWYRAEMVLKKNGQFAGRYPVGEGYSTNATEGEIYINLGPFEKTLVLSPKVTKA